LVTNDILNFHMAILSDPVLIHRFKEVRQSVILSIANKMLDLLRLSWNEGLEELIEPFFQQRVLDRVKEAEVDALFTHFLKNVILRVITHRVIIGFVLINSRKTRKFIEMVVLLPRNSSRRFKRTPYSKTGL